MRSAFFFEAATPLALDLLGIERRELASIRFLDADLDFGA